MTSLLPPSNTTTTANHYSNESAMKMVRSDPGKAFVWCVRRPLSTFDSRRWMASIVRYHAASPITGSQSPAVITFGRHPGIRPLTSASRRRALSNPKLDGAITKTDNAIVHVRTRENTGFFSKQLCLDNYHQFR